jgi:hypothetical protein
MSQYPENSTAKQYFDSDGYPQTLRYMVLNETEWAYSRIKEGEKAIAQRDELLAKLTNIVDILAKAQWLLES